MGRFSVVGLAKSGVAAANALARRGHDVTASDLGTEASLEGHLARLDPRVAVRLGTNAIRPGDTVVVSPGIKPHAPVFAEAARLGCQVIGEIALFQRLAGGTPVLAVTGTDGKSTTTVWLGEMVAASGRHTWVGGNLGTPLCEALDTLRPDHVVVAEVSCFQLVTAEEFHPRVAAVTNIAEDHVDYHGSFEAYVAAKALVLRNLGPGETAVLNADDAVLAGWQAPGGARTWRFGLRGLPESAEGLTVQDGTIVLCTGGRIEPLVAVSELRVPGRHNVENALAAAGAALAFGIEPDAVRHALLGFRGLEHRIELVREVGGVRFYNDSKATNPHASEAALRAFDEPIVLLCGGSEKGSEFTDWAALAAARCRHVVCFGQTGPRIAAALGDRVPVSRAGTLSEALATAVDAAAGHGVVVLSPACASFDQFSSFEDRGRQFKALVARL